MILKVLKKDGESISNEKELVELFNENNIHIVESTSGTKSLSLGNCSSKSCDEMTVKDIISVYSSHPSITLDLSKANVSDINKIIKSLNTNKAKKQTVFLLNS